MKRMIKHFLVMLLLIAVMTSAFCITAYAEEVEPAVCYDQGDVNGDGKVDSRDAIYVLYNYIHGEEEYPIYQKQSTDFDNSGSTDVKDAIKLLYAAMGMGNAPLCETFHVYYKPEWTWKQIDGTEDWEATVAYTCACGRASNPAVNANITKDIVAPSCTSAGKTTYTAILESDSSQYVVDHPALGHQMITSEGVACEQYTYCKNCDYATTPVGHSYEVTVTAATCAVPVTVETWTCTACGDTFKKEEQSETVPSCSYVLKTSEDVELDPATCKWAKKNTYECSVCHDIKEEQVEEFFQHTYSGALTLEPTCSTPGTKTYTCSVCGFVNPKTETVATNPNAHLWDTGSANEDGITIYACACGETKSTVAADETGAVSKEALTSVSEIQLANDTAIAMEESVVEQLTGDIQIKVNTIAVSDLNLAPEQKQQIGDSPVYDFSMVNVETNETVSKFSGTVTISLPYTLQDGEDIDSIDVWFIADDGSLTAMKGTYANGFVTFTTNHFSYYTVTRLTPAERCARYGHMMAEVKKTPTCTSDGYTVNVCQRCGIQSDKQILPATGHNYQETITGLTCETNGIRTQICSACGNTVVSSVPATGHNMVEDTTKYVEPTCTAPGKRVSYCTNDGCTYILEEELAQLPHQYVDEKKDADCTSNGHHKKRCTICGAEQFIDETAPTGHHYSQENAVWEWGEDYSWAKVTLVCSYTPNHTKELNAVITRKNTDLTSCEEGRTVVYTATATFNKWDYTDEVTVVLPEGAHLSGNVWYNNENQHFYKCTLCKAPIDPADHSWNDGIITPATCNETGTAVYQCQICSYKKTETLPATGEHTYEDGQCSVCGAAEKTCDHVKLTKHNLDLSGYNICESAKIEIYSCECGEQAYVASASYSCKMKVTTEEWVDDGNYEWQEISTYKCSDCGLTIKKGYGNKYSADPCTNFYSSLDVITLGDTVIFDGRWYDPEWLFFAHPTNIVVDSFDLSEYGLCSERIEVRTCPCGQKTSYYGTGCSWTWSDDALTCSNCKAVRTESMDWKSESCNDIETMTYSYYVNGEKVYEYSRATYYYVHNWVVSDYDMEGSNCTDGIMVYYTCSNCSETKESYATYHMPLIRKEVDLTNANICCDLYVQEECPCSFRQSSCHFEGNSCWSWNWQSHDDATNSDTYVCADCQAVKIENRSSSEPDENCYVSDITSQDYYDKEGNFLFSSYTKSRYPSHTYGNPTYELLGSTCEDGVKVVSTCVNCGSSNYYPINYHEVYLADTIDLEKFGAVCGSNLNHYSCACGAKQRYDFAEDANCDLEQASTPVWIDGAIIGDQWTTDNSFNYFGGNPYIFTCAVTNPQQCGLKIRMAEYWLQEDNCTAKEYQTWQLGYDERSNTWDKEITVPTGETQTRHPYEKTVTQGTTDDGTYLQCTTEICPDCGSSCEIKFWYPDSTMRANIKYQRNIVNTLNNGMNKQFTYTWCDDLIHAGYRYRTLELLEYVNSNGSTYWDRYDYTYNFPAGCVRTTAYSNSNGGSSTSTGTDHRKSYVNQYDPSTCTQYGTQYQGKKCNVCGHTDSAVTQLKPKAHNWVWNSTLQTYVCSYCDLENSNGASGMIVMEDLTDTHGGGTDYVIGYWNRGGIDFTPVVQVVLDDIAQNQDNLLSLSTFINFTYREDVVAVACHKAEVQAAVDAALEAAGYSGSYAIRITFLPASPTGELDYAITFDSQNTN